MLLGSETFPSFSDLALLRHLFSTPESRPRVPTLSTLWKYPEGHVRIMVGSWADWESGVPQTLLISHVLLRSSLVKCASNGSSKTLIPAGCHACCPSSCTHQVDLNLCSRPWFCPRKNHWMPIAPPWRLAGRDHMHRFRPRYKRSFMIGVCFRTKQVLHTIRSSSRGQRKLENMCANSATGGFARVRATDIHKKKHPFAVALTPPSGFANAVARAPMSAGVSSGIEARPSTQPRKRIQCVWIVQQHAEVFLQAPGRPPQGGLEGRSSDFPENLLRQHRRGPHYLWNPALHLRRHSVRTVTRINTLPRGDLDF